MADRHDFDYDSAAVRRAARQVLNCAEIIADGAQPKLRNIRGEVDDNIKGKAADALDDRLADIDTDVRSIISGLRSLGNALNSYAAALERTARELADALK